MASCKLNERATKAPYSTSNAAGGDLDDKSTREREKEARPLEGFHAGIT